jgi:hypothetical protein
MTLKPKPSEAVGFLQEAKPRRAVGVDRDLGRSAHHHEALNQTKEDIVGSWETRAGRDEALK